VIPGETISQKLAGPVNRLPRIRFQSLQLALNNAQMKFMPPST
jgi:hypothetical protein